MFKRKKVTRPLNIYCVLFTHDWVKEDKGRKIRCNRCGVTKNTLK